MPRNLKLPGRIIVEDDMGRKIELKGSLVALFCSEKMKKSYQKDPERLYSLRELISMMVAGSKCSIETMRRNVHVHFKIFEKDKMGETRMQKNGLAYVTVHKLKPFVKFIFKAIEGMQGEK
jgi:hypothetical protein